MIIQSFLTIQNQLKVLHWQTTSYSAHKALGKAYDALDGLMDQFVEVYAGGDRGILKIDSLTTKCHGIEAVKPMDFIDSVDKFISGKLSESIPEERTDLHNIKDEMLGVVNHTRYLLNLQ
jgi:hypothetical protein